jgi:GGDEF domain-containing protein
MDDEQFLADIQAASADSIRWAFLACARLLGASRASLLLRDADGDVMQAAAWVGIDSETAEQISVPFGHGLAGLAAQRNMALFGDADGTKYMIVPIVYANRVAGVINLTERHGNEDFNDVDLHLAQAMADHIAHLLTQEARGRLDARSGLPGERSFVDALEREVERGRRTGSAFTLALIRVSQVEYLEKTLGEERFAEVLRDIGQTLEAACRRYDVVGHPDPGTYGILFPSTDRVTPQTFERLTDAVSRVLDPVDGSSGVESAVVHYPADGATVRDLMGLARRLCDEQEGTLDGEDTDGSTPRLLRPPSR